MTPLLAVTLFLLPWFSSAETEPAEAEVPAEKAYAVSDSQAKIRAFRYLGDMFLHGDTSAYEQRKKILNTLGNDLAKSDGSVWSKPKDLEVLLLFVLFGGGAQPLKLALSHEKFPEQWKDLAQGLIAYADRQLDLARERLNEQDATSLPSTIRAPFMLIQGTLISATDSEKALGLFRRVRVMEPGTALEEAAMRQEVLVLLGKEKTKEAMSTLARYLRRYPKAVYWPQFSAVAAKSASALSDMSADDLVAVVESVPNTDGADRYRNFLLEMARNLLITGDFKRAGQLGESMIKIAEPGSQAWRRAKLYKLAAEVVSSDPDQVRQALLKLDVDDYGDDEKGLVRAAITIAEQIIRGYKDEGKPQRERPKLGMPVRMDASSKQGGDKDAPSALVPDELRARAKETLEKATSALSGPEKTK